MRNITARATALAVASLLTAPALWASPSSLSGRVFIADDPDRGIAGVTITLRAPVSEGGREITTATNDGGEFLLRELPPRRYLLTASRGSTLLYRQVVVVKSDLRVNIPVNRR